MNETRRFGPKKADHPSVRESCPACKQPFAKGDYTALMPLGPSDNKEEQDKCRDGLAYNAVAVEVHYACATGIRNE